MIDGFYRGVMLLLLFIMAVPSFAAEPEIGRMRVAIWPEYDDPGVLGIYDGRFVDDGNFPLETTFILPKGAVISDACSLSPRGQHFCQLFEQKSAGDVEEVSLKLPYPNFYLSFHTEPFDGSKPDRVLDYMIITNHNIKNLEVDIQEPLRAEEFSVKPEPAATEEEKGFRHYRYTFEDRKKGEVIPVEIRYKKADNRPSVNIKYTPMSESATAPSPFKERGRFINALYLLAAAGVVVLGGIMWFLLRKKED